MSTHTTRRVKYHADAASLFAHLGGTTTRDTVLLESADITTRSGIQSVAVLRAAVRVTCSGSHVHVEPLTSFGRTVADRVQEQLGEYLSLIHISEPTRREWLSRMPSSA